MAINAFFANPTNANLFKEEYGFYWERSTTKPDASGRVVKTEDWTLDKRKQCAKNGTAMKDGSFPIENTQHVHDAVDDWGRAGAKPSVKEHIKARAKSLDASHLLPDSWQDKPTNQNSNADSTAA